MKRDPAIIREVLAPDDAAQLTMLYRAGARDVRCATPRCVIAGGPGELDPQLLKPLMRRGFVRAMTLVRHGWKTEMWWLTPAGCKAAEFALLTRAREAA